MVSRREVHSVGASSTPAGVRISDLLREAGAGDESAFAAFYDATSARAYGLALRVIRDPAQAEEVTQEAYLKVWRNPSRYDSRRGSGLSWILTTVHGTAVDRVRATQAGTNRDVTYHRNQTFDRDRSADPTHDLVASSIQSTQVRAAVAQLSPRKREALELAYFDAHTHAEVARVTGVPLGTAKTRIRDGLIELRALLVAQPAAPSTP